MPHVPSEPNEIAERILGRFTSLSGANTAAANADIAALIGRVSEEISIVDRRYAEFVLAHGFRGLTDAQADERVGQLPKDFPRRYDASRATGGSFMIRRLVATEEVVFEKGTIRASQRYDSKLVYTNNDQITMGIGVTGLTGLSFVCATPGSAGSVGVGDVSVVDSSPGNVIYFVRNMAGMVGVDTESTSELLRRAERWLWSLSATQREAVVVLLKNFRSQADPTVILEATAFFNPERRGYGEVYIENGSAMVGFTRPAVVRSGIIPTLPAGRQHIFHFDYPAVNSPRLRIKDTLGVVVGDYEASSLAWTAQEETGEMWIRRTPEQYGLDTLTPGYTWETYGHYVFWGITAEAQNYVNRYCTAFGSRVRVMHGTPQYISFYANAVIEEYPGRTRSQIMLDTKDAIISYTQRIPPGGALKIYDLIPELKARVRGLINLLPDHSDLYAWSPKHKLILTRSLIFLR